MNVDLLTTTRIGKTISKLVKDKRSSKVVVVAKELEKNWKSIVQESSKTTPKSAAEKRKREETTESPGAAQKRKISHGTTQKNTPPAPAPPKVQPKKEVKTVEKKEVKEENKEPEKKEDIYIPGAIPVAVKDFKGESSNSARNQVQIKLWQALGACQVQGGKESSKVAVAIESELFTLYKDPKDKDYLQKI